MLSPQEIIDSNSKALYTVGERVITQYGLGVVQGFELFTDTGETSPELGTEDCGGCQRVVVALDCPERFPFPFLPHFFRKQIGKLQ